MPPKIHRLTSLPSAPIDAAAAPAAVSSVVVAASAAVPEDGQQQQQQQQQQAQRPQFTDEVLCRFAPHVSLVKRSAPGRPPLLFVRKIISDPDSAIRELGHLQTQCRHPNVLRYLAGAKHRNGTADIDMEYCDVGAVREALRAVAAPDRHGAAKAVARQVFAGLAYYLAVHGRAHRCIHPSAFLLRHDGVIKIKGFDQSRLMGGGSGGVASSDVTVRGTNGYLAPELVLGLSIDVAKCDAWSTGIALWQVATAELNRLPFDHFRLGSFAAPEQEQHVDRLPWATVFAGDPALEYLVRRVCLVVDDRARGDLVTGLAATHILMPGSSARGGGAAAAAFDAWGSSFVLPQRSGGDGDDGGSGLLDGGAVDESSSAVMAAVAAAAALGVQLCDAVLRECLCCADDPDVEAKVARAAGALRAELASWRAVRERPEQRDAVDKAMNAIVNKRNERAYKTLETVLMSEQQRAKIEEAAAAKRREEEAASAAAAAATAPPWLLALMQEHGLLLDGADIGALRKHKLLDDEAVLLDLTKDEIATSLPELSLGSRKKLGMLVEAARLQRDKKKSGNNNDDDDKHKLQHEHQPQKHDGGIAILTEADFVSTTLFRAKLPQRWIIDPQLLSIDTKDVVGSGGQSTILGATLRSALGGSPKSVVVKIYRDPATMRRWCREIYATLLSSHRFIVAAHGVVFVTTAMGEEALLVLERGECSLEKYLERNPAISVSEAYTFLRQNAEALAFLHCRGALHLDQKAQNIILMPGRSEIRVCDLGLAALSRAEAADAFIGAVNNSITGGSCSSGICGAAPAAGAGAAGTHISVTTQGLTLNYAPPEAHRPGECRIMRPTHDVFSFGATAFRVCNGKKPFWQCVTVADIVAHRLIDDANDEANLLPHFRALSPEQQQSELRTDQARLEYARARRLVAVMRACLQYEREKRPKHCLAVLKLLLDDNEAVPEGVVPPKRRRASGDGDADDSDDEGASGLLEALLAARSVSGSSSVGGGGSDGASSDSSGKSTQEVARAVQGVSLSRGDPALEYLVRRVCHRV